ncbi:MAG: NADH-quinone oxidoreductase subunit N [Nitriliruptorales bacterium]
MTPLLAQLTPPPVAWGALAPDLLLVGAALALLLVIVAGEARIAVAAASGLVAAGVGVWLLLRGITVPGAVVLAFGAGLIAVEVALPDRPDLAGTWLAAVAFAGAFALTVWQWFAIYQAAGAQSFLGGAIGVDGVALFVRGVVHVSALLVLPIGAAYLQERGIYRTEFEPLLLLSAIGMSVLASAGDLLVVFIAIELLSLPLYVLAGLARRDRRSQEASIKYFLLGAVTSAVLVYGIALVYTATGTVRLAAIADGLGLVTTPFPVALLGAGLLTVGLGFKAAAVPFHFWTPDVYQGSPTNVTAFMAAATKAAAFAALLRVYFLAFERLEASWVPVFAGVAAATMMLGAVLAVVQRDVKRVLAYSSIAHAGYALVGLTSASVLGLSATLFYLLTYAVTSIGAFGCVVAVERLRRGEVALVDLKGLGRRSPALAGVFGLCLLSLAGIPLTAGFVGKLGVFRAGVEAGLWWLVVIGVVSSVVAGFFYLRLIAAMFLEEPDSDALPVLSTGLSVGVALAAAAVIWLGILPNAVVTIAEQAASIAR